MIILGIETSCDETAISIIETDGESVRVLANAVHSQVDLHREYGGVFPTLAKREHAKNLVPIFARTLGEAGLLRRGATALPPDIEALLAREPELLTAFKDFIPTIAKPSFDLIAVTEGPGLEPALWVGINFARALGQTFGIPVMPANHMEGHVLISLLKKKSEAEYAIVQPAFPALALLISGGHTEMVLAREIGSYQVVGKTRDDAVGECFDKVARLLGLPYPGGPEISRLAAQARAESIASPVALPRPMIDSPDLDFSFSGLKTAARYAIENIGELSPADRAGISRETEDAITDVLIAKVRKAIDAHGIQSLIAGGGVIANAQIRSALAELAREAPLPLYLPEVSHSTDNALMISLVGYFKYVKGVSLGKALAAEGNAPIGSDR